MVLSGPATGELQLAGQWASRLGGFECQGIPYGTVVFWLLAASFLLMVVAAIVPTGDSPESGEMGIYVGIFGLILVFGLSLQACPVDILGPFGTAMFSVLWPLVGVIFSGFFVLRAGTFALGEGVTAPVYAIGGLFIFLGMSYVYLRNMFADFGILGILFGIGVLIWWIRDA